MGKMSRTERRRIDASTVAVVVRNRKAVEYYRRHPNGSFDFWGNGGRPLVGRGRGGKLVAWEGNHRIAAAAAEGRSIVVDFALDAY